MFNENKTIKFLWQFIKKYKISIILTFLIGVALPDMLELLGRNVILKNLVDKIYSKDVQFNYVIISVFAIIFLSSQYFISQALRKKLSFSFEFGLKEDVRNYLFQYLLKQSNAFFSDNFVGTLNSKINDIVNNIGEFINNFFDIFSNLTIFCVVMCIFAKTDYRIAISFFVWFVLYIIVFVKINAVVEKQTEIASSRESECSGKIIDCFTNIINIKNFSRERREKYNIKKYTKEILMERDKIFRTKTFFNIVNFAAMSLLCCITALFSIDSFFKNKISAGELVFNVQIVVSLFYWLRWALVIVSTNIELYGKFKQAVETIIVERKILDKENAQKINVSSGKIVFNNINFKY